MTHAVAKIVAINAITPAATGFGVHWYSIFEKKIPMNTTACKNFMGGPDAL